MTRRLMVSSLAAGLVLSTIALPAAGQVAGFTDVPRDNVHAAEITRGTETGIIEGKTSTRFDPAGSLTRGQTASLIARALDRAEVELPPLAGAPTFTDIGAPHGDNIRRLAAAGIVQGKGDGRFDTQGAVTRDQLASLYVRAYLFSIGDLQEEIVPGVFDDVPADSVHAIAIDTAAALGLMQGKGDGRFAPRDETRRDQAAAVVMRFLDTVEAIIAAPFQLTVLHANDGESALLPNADTGDPGVGRFVHDLQALQLEAFEADVRGAVVTVSAGDNYLAGPQLAASTEQEDGPFYDALVYIAGGFDAMTIGNHEFDFGPDLLADFIEATVLIPHLSANLDFSGEPRLAALEETGQLASSVTTRRAGRDIAIVGATTDQLPSISSPRNVVTNPVLEAVQAEVAAVRAAGADVVVLSQHLQDLDIDQAMVADLSGVDAVIGGGGGEDLGEDYPFSATDADGVDVPVVTTPGRYRDIGKLVLDVSADDAVTLGEGSELFDVLVEGEVVDEVVEFIETPVAAYVEALAANVIGQTEVDLDGVTATVRTRETNMGDLFADSMLAAARAQADEFDAPVADIALQNSGGIRSDAVLAEGDITELDTYNYAAFFNLVSVAEIDVTTLRQALERGVSGAAPQGRFGQWAGVEFTYDLSQQEQVSEVNGNVTTEGERIVDAVVTTADGERIVVVEDGVTVDTDRLFAIATNDFTFRAGDAYPFNSPDNPVPFQVLGITYQQALLQYISETVDGLVTAEEYPNLTLDGADEYRRFGPVGEFTIPDDA